MSGASPTAASTNPSTTARPLIKRPAEARYKTLLCIDGGGIRGIIPAQVLLRLQQEIKNHIFENRESLIPEDQQSQISSVDDFDVDLTDYFDVVAGTSIGSWLAVYVAGRGRGTEAVFADKEIQKKHGALRVGSMEAVQAVFLEYGPSVFPRRNIFSRVASLFRPRYSTAGLESTLTTVFGDTTFKELETGCLITSYDLNRNAACSFLRGTGPDAKTYTVCTAVRECPRVSLAAGAPDAGGEEGESVYAVRGDNWEPDLEIIPDTNYRIRDIALASSSAPTYFGPARISRIDTDNAEELLLVDGGVVANNPTLQAITYMPNTFSTGSIRDVAVFSVGCGAGDPVTGDRDDPGVGWWLRSGVLIDSLQNGTGEWIQAIVDFWIYRNLGLPFGQYVRIQKSARADTDLGRIFSNLDDVENMPALMKIGKELGEENASYMRLFIKNHIFAT